MKLISMTDFVLNQKQSESFNEKTFINEALISLENIRNYANFLKQPLKLEMFVPYNEEGNIYAYEYEEPIQEDYWSENGTVYSGELFKHDLNRYMKYKKAKEKVLFEGIPIAQAKWLVKTLSTIESLSYISNTITPIYLNNNAIKQIGL